MKQKILMMVAVLWLTAANISAQEQVPNGDFETWSGDTPEKWGSLNLLSAFGAPKSVKQSTDAQSGSFAMQLETIAFTNPLTQQKDTIPGIAFLGGLEGLTPTFGAPFTSKPVKLKGYFKYTPAGDDTCGISVSLVQSDTSGQPQVMAAGAFINFLTVSNYTAFEITLNYNPAVQGNPDSLVIMAFSSLPADSGGAPDVGSTLLLDNLTFEYAGTGITETVDKMNISVYPVPATTSVVFDNLMAAGNARLEVYDLLGEMMITENISSDKIELNTRSYPAGTYFYSIRGERSEIIERGKFQISR